MERQHKNLVPFHPILVGIYPILYLLASNINQIQPAAALRAGGLSLAGCLLLYLFLRLLFKDAGRAALLASFWLILFYSYGHVYQLLEGGSWLGFVYGKHRFLIAAWLALLLIGSGWLWKKVKSARQLNQVLNLVSILLVVLPLLQIGWFAYQFQRQSIRAQALARTSTSALSVTGANAAEDPPGPDIYYIVLDGYSRADVLKNLYNLDITPFMDEMRSLGFVFPNCTQSNYGVTSFSIFSSLNMDYLDGYPDVFTPGLDDNEVNTTRIYQPIRNSQVRQFLEQRGYKIIAFETDFWWLNLTDADMYIVENDNPLVKYSKSYEVSSFEDMFIRTTALRVLSETTARFSAGLNKQIRTPNERRYEVTRFSLEQAEKLPEIPGRKFVYLHLLAPHSPFVFDAEGNFVDYKSKDGDNPAYPNEIVYLNKRVLELARSLIASSKTPPIIVIQGDHGWDPRYRMQILNAYYLPNGGDRLLYPEITPVNTFRLIFNEYFGGKFDLQKDASFFSITGHFRKLGIEGRPYQLTPVPDTCMGK